jgi:hypothetical protein
VRGSLIGGWILQNCVRTFADGHKEYPFGEKPVGRFRRRPSLPREPHDDGGCILPTLI